jgi:predicted MFS family arabinose efflux permease
MLFAFQAVTAFLTTYFVDVRSISQTRAGLYLSVLFVGGAIGQTTTGALADRYGTPRVLTAVALVSVLPLVAIPLVTDQLALGVLSFAVGLRMSSGPLSNAYIVDCLPEAAEGTAWGALRTGFFAVGSLGSTVVGALAERGFFTESFYLLAAITLLAAVAYVRLPER